MKKTFNKVPKLKTENGILSGGFAPLDLDQMNKIQGGKRRADNNECHNVTQCSGNNTGCTNDLQCS